MHGGNGYAEVAEDGSLSEAGFDRHKAPLTVPKGRVLSTQFIYIREDDHKIVGMIDIRHDFNDCLKKFGGHIGYSE